MQHACRLSCMQTAHCAETGQRAVQLWQTAGPAEGITRSYTMSQHQKQTAVLSSGLSAGHMHGHAVRPAVQLNVLDLQATPSMSMLRSVGAAGHQAGAADAGYVPSTATQGVTAASLCSTSSEDRTATATHLQGKRMFAATCHRCLVHGNGSSIGNMAPRRPAGSLAMSSLADADR